MRVLTEDKELEELSKDSGIIKVKPSAACIATNESEVESVFGLAREWKKSVTPRGAGTSIPSQSVGKGLILLQRRGGLKVLPGGFAECEPGLVKADLNKYLEQIGRWMPVDPSSYQSCTIGGMTANNSSGIRTPAYGSTIDYVDKIRGVMPGAGVQDFRSMPLEAALSGSSGVRKAAELIQENWKTILSEMPRVSKNSSGYRLERVLHDGVFDMPKLLVGSEGTLAIFTLVTFRTLPKVGSRILLIVEVELDELDGLVSAFKEHGPTAVELIDKSVFRKTHREDKVAKYSRTDSEYLVFCEYAGSDEDMRRKLEDIGASKLVGAEPMVLTAQSDVKDAWEVRNETLTLALEIREGRKVLVPGIEDLVVPPERLGDLVKLLRDQFETRGLSYISYGHACDANLHARPLLDVDVASGRRILDDLMIECFEAVWRMGGSMTGEHGDGILRAPYVARQYPKSHPIMKEIREVLDPTGTLNPGVKIV